MRERERDREGKRERKRDGEKRERKRQRGQDRQRENDNHCLERNDILHYLMIKKKGKQRKSTHALCPCI